MKSTDTIAYNVKGFDNDKYFKLQKEKILERIDLFREGKLYLEIGGKFLFDPHAARVLPGFDPVVKQHLFSSLKSMTDIYFCTNAQDIRTNRQLNSSGEGYMQTVTKMVKDLEENLGIKPKIVVNLCERHQKGSKMEFERAMNALGYETYKRYKIQGYPNNNELVLSDEGYGYDDHIEGTKKLILVVGAASNSGKMSTCLGQIFKDKQKNITSGYAKYETFPIWSLPLSHPINLAYEAATADIGDFNMIDTYHEEAYGKRSVNYNRDVDAFEIIRGLSQQFLDTDNPMTDYKSPTDMGINYAGSAIIDDQVTCVASLEEITRRKGWYQEIYDRGDGEKEPVRKCEKLEVQAIKYIREQGYNPEFELF